MKNDTHTAVEATTNSSICFYGEHFALLIALFIALTVNFFIRQRRKIGDARFASFTRSSKREAAAGKKVINMSDAYPFPFLFLLDFFLGRTISIHFCIFAPNIATLICP